MSLTSNQWISIGVAILLLLVLSQGQYQHVSSSPRLDEAKSKATPTASFGAVNIITGELVFPYPSGIVFEGGTNASQAIRICGSATTAPSALGSSPNQIQFYTGTNLSAVLDTDGLYVSDASKLQIGTSLSLSHSTSNATSYLDCDQLTIRQSNSTLSTLTIDATGNLNSTGNLSWAGNGTMAGSLSVAQNAVVGNTLSISGYTHMYGNMDVSGNSIVAGNTTVKGNVATGGNSDISGNSSVTGNTTLKGNVAVGGNVDVSGNFTVRSGTNQPMISVTNTGLSMGDASALFMGAAGSLNSYVSLAHNPMGYSGAILSYDTLSFLNITGILPLTTLYLNSNGNIGIGNVSPQYPLDITGNANVSGILSAVNLSVSTTAVIGNVTSLTSGYALNVGGSINCNQIYVNGNLLNVSTNLVNAGNSNTFTAQQIIATASASNLALVNTNTSIPTPASLTFNDTNAVNPYRAIVSGGSVNLLNLAWSTPTSLPSGQAMSIAVSNTGQYQLIAGYKSTSYSYTLNGTSATPTWNTATVSDAGTYGYVSTSGQYQYVLPYGAAKGWYSSTYGASFAVLTSGFTRGLGQCMATSTTATYALMGSLRGELYWSNNSGTTTLPTFTALTCGASVPTLYGEWFQIKLTTATAIGGYQVAPRNKSGHTGGYQSQHNNRFPNAWYLLASNDGSTWSVLDYQTKQSGDTAPATPTVYPGFNSYTVLPTIAYAYYRFVWTGLNSNYMDIGGLVLLNTSSVPLFPSYSNYTVSGYNLQASGTTVATVTVSNNPTGSAFVNTYVTDDASTKVPLVLTGDGYLYAPNSASSMIFYGFYLSNNTEYSANYVAIAGTSMNVTAYGQYTSCAMSGTGQYSIVAYTYPFYSILYVSSTTNSANVSSVQFAPLTTANGLPNLTGSYQWTSVVMSSSGQYILALCSNGKLNTTYSSVYLCTNGTAGVASMQFTLLNASNGIPMDTGTFGNLGMSSSGQYMTMSKDRCMGYSTNYGATWTFMAVTVPTKSLTDMAVSGDGTLYAYTDGTSLNVAKPTTVSYGGYYADVTSSVATTAPLGSALAIVASNAGHSVNVNSNLCLASDGTKSIYFTDVAGQVQASYATYGRLYGKSGSIRMDYFNSFRFNATDISGNVLANPVTMRTTGTSLTMDIKSGSLVTFYDEANSTQPFGMYNLNGVMYLNPRTASGDYNGIAGLSMDASGNVNVSGVLTNSSDARLKQNIAPIDRALERVLQLKPSTFSYKNNPHQLTSGFIAQDIQTVFPDLVHTDATDMLTVSTLELIPHMVASTQDIYQELQETKAELNDVKAKLARILSHLGL